ncbi:tyrosine-type recombinase/integrase [Pseudomonas aeruginosa]
MATQRLTAQKIDTIVKNLRAPESGRRDKGLVDGLAIRVSHTGKKTFISRYRVTPNSNPKTHVHPTPYPALSVKAALEAHYKLIEGLKASGIDPNVARKQAAKQEAMALSVDDVWRKYYEKAKQKLAESTLYDYQGRYLLWIKPYIGSIKMKRLSEEECIELIQKVHSDSGTAQGGAKTAKVCLTILKSICREGIHQKQMKTQENPTLGLTPNFFELPPSERKQRVLSIEEIINVWRLIEAYTAEGAFEKVSSLALQIAIITGMRRQEVVSIHKNHLIFNDDGSCIYTLPSTIMKGRKAHTVFIPEFLTKKIKESMRADKDYVLWSPAKRENTHINTETLNNCICALLGIKEPKLARSPHLDMERFSPHDLRRSFATGLKKYLNASRGIIHRMIAHGSDDDFDIEEDKYDRVLDKIYIVDDEEQTQRRLWQAWSDLIQSRLEGTSASVSPQVTDQLASITP